MTPTAVGIVSAGEMGSALGAALRAGGARVVTTVAGRSTRTAGLAATAGLELLPDLDAVVRASSVLLSVVSPQDAGTVAETLLAHARRAGVAPVLADLNAIAPEQVADLAAAADRAGLPFVDGAVSGAPPQPDRPLARLLLSGPAARRVAVLDGPAGAASAAKMCTGGVRKGVTALVINALLVAAEHGVLEPVVAELQRSLRRDPVLEAELAAAKAWRFAPEMEAVAATQAAAGLDPALHRAIAAVFERTASSPLARRAPEQVDRAERGADATRIVSDLRPLPAPGTKGRGSRPHLA
jgi:3-hydroxyisobutyrate dehydrogenase-like beta-hydroxyacid dehydrogenase